MEGIKMIEPKIKTSIENSIKLKQNILENSELLSSISKAV